MKIPVVVLDDLIPEPNESFFIYLHDATGGAKISNFKLGGIMEVTIAENDSPNGHIGFKKIKGKIGFIIFIQKFLNPFLI